MERFFDRNCTLRGNGGGKLKAIRGGVLYLDRNGTKIMKRSDLNDSLFDGFENPWPEREAEIMSEFD